MAKHSETKQGRSFHVVPHTDGWAVKAEGRKRNSSIHETQKDAISVARTNAKSVNGKLIIHKRDGSIREKAYCQISPAPRTVLVPTLKSKKREDEIRTAVREIMLEMEGKSIKR